MMPQINYYTKGSGAKDCIVLYFAAPFPKHEERHVTSLRCRHQLKYTIKVHCIFQTNNLVMDPYLPLLNSAYHIQQLWMLSASYELCFILTYLFPLLLVACHQQLVYLCILLLSIMCFVWHIHKFFEMIVHVEMHVAGGKRAHRPLIHLIN